MNCPTPKEVWPDNKRRLVPCGKCLACLSNKRNDWVLRLQQEHKVSQGALMITLTYHARYCPDQLSKRHLQLFMKRLRKNEKGNRIRYFAVGEYGTEKGRPHYHVILFNCDQSGETIRKAWKFGIIDIRPINDARLSYVTKYVIQPDHFTEGKQKPFALMSRAYGLGLSYLSENMIHWHRSGNKNYTMIDGVKRRLPRYYKDKIWYRVKNKKGEVIEHPDRKKVADESKWLAIKQARKELRWFVKRYGSENAIRKRTEFRNAVLSRIKVKVAYTQTIK